MTSRSPNRTDKPFRTSCPAPHVDGKPTLMDQYRADPDSFKPGSRTQDLKRR